MKIRLTIFLTLLIGIAVFITHLALRQHRPSLPETLSPFFQQIGKPVQSANRALSKMLPISELDEKMLGDEIRKRYENNYPIESPKAKYLNTLMQELTRQSKKGFTYTVFLISGDPNAYALPGGVICVTEELLELMSNEAELVAILGHEIGHIERGHLFHLYQSEMMRRKTKSQTIESYATDLLQIFETLFYNKTQEDEADEYGYKLLLAKGYDPYALASTFRKFLQIQSDHADMFADFFSTHPYMTLREAKFYNRAQIWYRKHPEKKVYIGKKNLETCQTREEVTYESEYRIPKS